MKKTTLLKSYLFAPEILVIPGVHDPMCARIAQQVGFRAVFLSGYASSAALLGAPDIGLLTLTEMTDCARRICDAVDIPVFADGDTGHGNVNNVRRTMRDFERAGVAAVFFEDQVAPKRCGHMAGKQVVPAEEMLSRIRAAADARVDRDMVIMARTDALAIEGLDAAVERMARYVEAGADMAFVEAPESVEQMRRIVKALPVPQMANMVQGGKTPILPAKELEAIGFACVAYPTALTYVIARAATDTLEYLHTHGTTAGLEEKMMQFPEFNRMVGLPEIRSREERLITGSVR